MTEVELKIVGEVSALHLEPGDRIIVTIGEEHRHRIGAKFLGELRDELRREFPDNQIIILHGIALAKETA